MKLVREGGHIAQARCLDAVAACPAPHKIAGALDVKNFNSGFHYQKFRRFPFIAGRIESAPELR